jgi:hypothetical protein
MFAGIRRDVNEVSAVTECYTTFIDIFGSFGAVQVSPLLKKSQKNAMKICVDYQTNIEKCVSDDCLSEKWKEPIGLTASGVQGAEEFFLNSLTLKYGNLRPSRNVGNYKSTLRKIPEDRKYIVSKL